MNSKLKKISVIVLSFSLVVGSISMSASATSSSDLKKKKDALTSEKSQTESDVNSISSQLNTLVEKISETEVALTEKGEQVQESQAELKKAKKVEAKQLKLMKKRIVYMYESGNKQLLSEILSCDDLSELLTKYEYVSSISDSDRKVFNKYAAAKEKVETVTAQLEKEQAELEEQQKSYAAQQEELNNLLASKQDELASLQDQITETTQAYYAAVQAEQAAAAASRRSSSSNSSSSSAVSSGTVNDNKVQSVSASTVVNRALSQVGKPYIWGACGPNSFDCSGLVSYALTGRFSRLGVSGYFGSLTRVTNPQPGDLVCYVGHVAIYYGNGMQIEAQQTGVGVVVSAVRRGAWYTRY